VASQPPEKIIARERSGPISIEMTARPTANVSVLCSESMGASASCLACADLPAELGCGWCRGRGACVTRQHCASVSIWRAECESLADSLPKVETRRDEKRRDAFLLGESFQSQDLITAEMAALATACPVPLVPVRHNVSVFFARLPPD